MSDRSTSKRSKVAEAERYQSKKRRQEEAPAAEEVGNVPDDPTIEEDSLSKDSTNVEAESSEKDVQSEDASNDATKEHSYQKETKEQEEAEKQECPRGSEAKAKKQETVMFRVHRTGDIKSFIDGLAEETRESYLEELKQVREALDELKETGASPDEKGLLTANISFRFETLSGQEYFAVLRSGMKGEDDFDSGNDICLVSKFDAKNWCAEYMSEREEAMPTVDTPIHWACYKANLRYKWPEAPNAIMHGHALFTEELAGKLQLPITAEKAAGASPSDAHAVMAMFDKNPYPENKVFIQKGHGFIIMAKNMKEVLEEFEKTVVPNV